MPVELILNAPVKTYFVACPSVSPSEAIKFCYQQLEEIELTYCDCLFRGVEMDRISAIYRNYIDKEPTDAVIWADYLDKALEYGEWPKLVLILRIKQMQRSFRCASSAATEAEINEIRREYPTQVDQQDGTLYFSRLKADDPRLNTADEHAYGWFIAGHPKEALAGLIICYRPEDLKT